jgi:hypothetical protein
MVARIPGRGNLWRRQAEQEEILVPYGIPDFDIRACATSTPISCLRNPSIPSEPFCRLGWR